MTYPRTRPLLPTGLRRTDRARPVIPLPLRAGAVPAHPAAADHLAQIPTGNWCGSTNMTFGTCGPCDTFNGAIVTWKYLLGLDITGADEDVFDFYRRCGNPGFDPAAPPGPDGTVPGDDGVDMVVMLNEAIKGGITVTHADGGKETIRAVCFGEAGTAPDDIRAVTSVAGGSSLAWDLDTAQQDQLASGLWDYRASPPWGGHATFGGAYITPAGLHAADETLISWQQPVAVTDDFIGHQLGGHYLLVWRPLWDHPVFQAGVDQALFAAYYTAETGRPFPLPVPPAPPGPPAPAGLPPAVVKALTDPQAAAWCEQRHMPAAAHVAGLLNEARDAVFPPQ